MNNEIKVPVWKKATLSFKEAAQYYGIGEKTLRKYIALNKDASFILRIGKEDIRIKRVAFEKHITNNVSRL